MAQVLILMSTYNGERWLREQLDSIRSQTSVDVRLVVRDDGSKDGTLSFLKSYSKEYPDFRIKVIEGHNVGFVRSFTILLQEALKETDIAYFAFADQDDVWLPDKLNVAIATLSNKNAEISKQPMMYCSNTTLVDSRLNYIRNAWPQGKVQINKTQSLVESYATGCTMVFNRKAVEMYLDRFSCNVRVHDYFMYLICVFFGVVCYDPQSYILYRQHGHNQIGCLDFKSRWRKRIKLDWDKSHPMQNQAKLFLGTCKDILPVEDIVSVCKVAFYSQSIFSKLELIFDRKYQKSTIEADIMQKIKILLGLL